ncbi:MAG: hypothetical protein H6741_16400 [Alphaproteobacteria bacterium]|nr:hypothetical protein [Alphaproteobacteria bacterium]
MPEISLTDFVDFVTRTGTPRLTKVRQIRRRGEYQPIHDFWRDLRHAMVEQNRVGDAPDTLDSLLEDVRPGQVELYRQALAGYRRFVGRKQLEWIEPPRITWYQSGLGVRVNPELGLVIDGVPTLVKVSFKDKKLKKRSIESILLLMEDALRAHCEPHVRMAVLDLHRGKLFFSETPRWSQRPFLVSEAAAFSAMWTELDRDEGGRLMEPWPRPLLPLRSAAPLALGAGA